MRKRLLFLALVLCLALLLALPAAASSGELAGCSTLNVLNSDGVNCVVGFSSTDQDERIIVYEGGIGVIGPASGEPEEDAPWENFFELQVGAYMQNSQDHSFSPAQGLTVTVNSMEIETLSGENGVFSFSKDELDTSVTGSAETLYRRVNHVAEALVKATVSISGAKGGSVTSGTVCLRVSAPAYEPPEFELYTAESDGELLANGSSVCWYELTDGAVWLRPGSGFDESDRTNLSVRVNGQQDIVWNTSYTAAKISLPEPEDNWGFWLSLNCGLQ